MIYVWEYKQVIIVRTDLKITPAKLGVQIAHASITPILENIHNFDAEKAIYRWFALGNEQKKVILKAKSETKLLNIYKKAKDSGIPCNIIRDAGRTELEPDTVTALGFLPMKNEEIDKINGKLSLFR